MKEFKYTVEGISSPQRISDYMKRRLGYSASIITKIKFGGIFLNGKNVTTRATVECGDEILILFPDESSENIAPIKMPLDIVFEDDYIVCVNKPKNMPTHPSKGNNLPTLAAGLMAYYGENFVFRAVNRLDRDTSGLVLIAKDALSASKLCKAMKENGFDKRYIAVVDGEPSPKEALIEAPIKREKEGELRRIVDEDGKPAKTHYKVLYTKNGKSLVEFTLFTGRTHQIRVHSSYIGHPLSDDFLYGRNTGGDYFLHCFYLSFTHPITNERLQLKSIPKEYREYIKI